MVNLGKLQRLKTSRIKTNSVEIDFVGADFDFCILKVSAPAVVESYWFNIASHFVSASLDSLYLQSGVALWGLNRSSSVMWPSSWGDPVIEWCCRKCPDLEIFCILQRMSSFFLFSDSSTEIYCSHCAACFLFLHLSSVSLCFSSLHVKASSFPYLLFVRQHAECCQPFTDTHFVHPYL